MLAIIAGTLFALGRGSFFSEFGDNVSEPEQPHSTQFVLLAVIIALIIIITVRLNKLGYSEVQHIPVFVVMGVTALVVWLIFRHTGPGGEAIMTITRKKNLGLRDLTDEEFQQFINTPPPAELKDEKLNSLIDEGNYLGARKYLKEMVQMSDEMGNPEGHRMYKQYKSIITQAAMADKRRRPTKDK